MIFIRHNNYADGDPRWHIVRDNIISHVVGVFGVYDTLAASGHAPESAIATAFTTDVPEGDEMCARCLENFAREEAAKISALRLAQRLDEPAVLFNPEIPDQIHRMVTGTVVVCPATMTTRKGEPG